MIIVGNKRNKIVKKKENRSQGVSNVLCNFLFLSESHPNPQLCFSLSLTLLIEFCRPSVFRQVTDFANVFKAFIGTNWIGLPFAFKQSGIVVRIMCCLVLILIHICDRTAKSCVIQSPCHQGVSPPINSPPKLVYSSFFNP